MSTTIKIIKSDITKQNVDAIVNAANSSLMGGGGVDGAIHRAGGPAILEACRAITARQGKCKTGEAVITTGGNLPAKFVIHTVGPVWNGGNKNEAQLLTNAYLNSFKQAIENNVESIAFPNISTGIYGFPKDQAAAIAFKTITSFIEGKNNIQEILFVCFDDEIFSCTRHWKLYDFLFCYHLMNAGIKVKSIRDLMPEPPGSEYGWTATVSGA